MAEWDQAPLAGAEPEGNVVPLNSWRSAPVMDSSAKAVAGVSADANTAGKALKLSRQTGVAPSVIEGDVPSFEQRQREVGAAKAVQGNPFIAGYVDGNQAAARVSNDDYENLDKLSTSIQQFDNSSVLSHMIKGMKQGFGDEDLGFIKENMLKYPSLYLNWQPFVAPLDFLIRAPGAIVGAGSAGIAQAARQIGRENKIAGADAWGDRLERDLNIVGQGALIASGMESPVRPAIKKPAEAAPVVISPIAKEALSRGETLPPGVDPFTDQFHVMQQKVDEAKVDRIMQDAELSKTKERAPEALADFGQGHGTGDVYLPAEKIAEIYQKEGKVPAADDGLFGYVPDLQKQVQNGLATGQEVRIPFSGYIAHTDQALHGEVRDSLRLRHDGVTKEEASDLGKGAPAPAPAPRPTELPQEFETEKEALYLHPLFTEGKAVGVTESEFSRYSKNIEAAREDAFNRLEEVNRRAIARTRTEEWKKETVQTRAEVESDLRSQPNIVADRFLREGVMPTGERFPVIKLDENAVKQVLGEDHNLKDLVVAKGGAMPDLAAHFIGYSSGEAMLRDLDLLNMARAHLKESPKAYFDRVAEQETEARMFAKYGDLKELIQQEARAAVVSEPYINIISDEVRFLAKQAGFEPPMALADLKEGMAQRFGDTKLTNVSDVAAARRAVFSGGRAAEKALLAGKFEDAFRAKQRQQLAILALREGEAFQADMAKATKLFDKYAKNDTVGTVAQEYTNQIQGLLEQIGYGTGREVTSLARSLEGKPLNDFIDQQNAVGAMIPKAQLPAKNSWNEFTVDEFRDVATMIKSLDHNGREVGKIRVGEKKAAYEDVIGQAAKNLDDLEKKNFDPQKRGFVGSARRFLRSVDARLLKFEQLFDWIDKRDPMGIMNQSVYRALVEGEGRKVDMLGKLSEDILKINVSRGWGYSLSERVDNKILRNIDGDLENLTNENKIVTALNYGNKSNRDVLTKGKGWQKKDVQKFLDTHMTDEDWGFVTGVWRALDRLAPEIEKVTERRAGVPVPLVEPLTISTPRGPQKGGYYPLVKDPLAVLLGKQQAVDLFHNPYFDPLPVAHALKKRTGAIYPVDLTIGGLHGRIGEAVHAIYLQEAVANAQKVLGDPIIREGIAKAFGPEYVGQIQPWLEDIAKNGGFNDDRFLAWMSRNARENVTTMLMGWKVSTTAIHGLSAAASSAYEIGPIQLGKELKNLGIAQIIPDVARRFFANEKNMWGQLDWAYNNIPEIRNRQQDIQRDFGAQLNKLVTTGWVDSAAAVRVAHMKYAMSMVSYIDQLTATPVALSAYKKAVAEGLSHDDAAFAAGKAVRQAHGSPSLVNRANIGRGEVNRWLTIAYNGYWNHNYNRIRDVSRMMLDSNIDISNRFIHGAAAAAALVIAPAIIHQAIRGSDTESVPGMLAESLVTQFGGQIPVVNSLLWGVIHNRDPQVTPIDSFFKGVEAGGKDVYRLSQGREVNHLVKDILQMPGWAVGLGLTNQLGTTYQFVEDVLNDKQRPEGVMQWARGLVTGKAEPKEK